MASPSTEPRRGEVWLVAWGAARRGEPGKNRPAVVMTADRLSIDSEADLIAVVPLSSTSAASVLRPRVRAGEGVDRPSRAIPRAVRGMACTRLLRRLGELTPERLVEVEQALALVLGLGVPARGSRTSALAALI